MLIASKSPRHLTHILFALFALFFVQKAWQLSLKALGDLFNLGRKKKKKKIGPKVGYKLRFFAQ
jgi:hypothetical protein